jgi:hypothetical protein
MCTRPESWFLLGHKLIPSWSFVIILFLNNFLWTIWWQLDTNLILGNIFGIKLNGGPYWGSIFEVHNGGPKRESIFGSILGVHIGCPYWGSILGVHIGGPKSEFNIGECCDIIVIKCVIRVTLLPTSLQMQVKMHNGSTFWPVDTKVVVHKQCFRWLNCLV